MAIKGKPLKKEKKGKEKEKLIKEDNPVSSDAEVIMDEKIEVKEDNVSQSEILHVEVVKASSDFMKLEGMEDEIARNEDIDICNPDGIRQEAIEISESLKQLELKFIRLAKLLFIIHREKFWKDWGYNSFADYAIKELDIEQRKAYYLRKVYDRLVYKFGVSEEKVDQLGWTKATKVISLIDTANEDIDKDAVEKIVEVAKNQSRNDLDKLVRHRKEKSPKVSKEGNVSLVFDLPKDVYDLWILEKEQYAILKGIKPADVNDEVLFGWMIMRGMADEYTKDLDSIMNLFKHIEFNFNNIKVIAIDVLNKKLIYGKDFAKKFMSGDKDDD